MMVTYELEELLEDVFIDATNTLPGTNYTSFLLSNAFQSGGSLHPTESVDAHVMVLNLTYPEWNTQYYKTFGRCYTLDVPVWMKQARVISSAIWVRN